MALLICASDRDTSRLAARVAAMAPEIDVRNWPDIGQPEDIDFAVLWRQPPGLLAELTGLKAVSSLGAGVEHLVNDADLPAVLPLGRLAGPHLASDMAAYLVAQVLWHWKGLDRFAQQQAERCWKPWTPRHTPTIGLLGFGHLGQACARAFQALDLPVTAWTRRGQPVDGITVHSGTNGLATLAAQADYLICLLPLTDQTRGILNQRLFSAMKPDSVLINVGRGRHLVEDELVTALDQGRPALAILDVFEQEPLPTDHPFWQHPQIRITPHCSAITRSDEAAELIVESYRRVQSGLAPLGLVNRERGY
ncbi:MAG: 2-hydroxyacid dehydrogenase [Wenzhouxiangella sp.]